MYRTGASCAFIRTDPMPSIAPINPILPAVYRSVPSLDPSRTPSSVESPRPAEASPEAPPNGMSLEEEMDNMMLPVDWEMDDFMEEWTPSQSSH
ncbi:hypothetical protein HDV63DRAFT_385633 [Trichoderma sp. SZMC 28014]